MSHQRRPGVPPSVTAARQYGAFASVLGAVLAMLMLAWLYWDSLPDSVEPSATETSWVLPRWLLALGIPAALTVVAAAVATAAGLNPLRRGTQAANSGAIALRWLLALTLLLLAVQAGGLYWHSGGEVPAQRAALIAAGLVLAVIGSYLPVDAVAWPPGGRRRPTGLVQQWRTAQTYGGWSAAAVGALHMAAAPLLPPVVLMVSLLIVYPVLAGMTLIAALLVGPERRRAR